MFKILKEMAETLGILPAPEPPPAIVRSRSVINHRDYPAGLYLEARLWRGKVLRYVECTFTHTDRQTFFIDGSVTNDVYYSGRLSLNLSKMSRDGYPAHVVSRFSKEVLLLKQRKVVMDHSTGRFIYAFPGDRLESLQSVEHYIYDLLKLDHTLNQNP